MKLPEQYKNLTIDQKRIVVSNLITQYGNNANQDMMENLSKEWVEFLFKYFFTESKEEREKMWNDMRQKHEAALKELEEIANKLQNLNLKFAELLAQKEDAEEFKKSFK